MKSREGREKDHKFSISRLFSMKTNFDCSSLARENEIKPKNLQKSNGYKKSQDTEDSQTHR
jgi:hypothetical protein